MQSKINEYVTKPCPLCTKAGWFDPHCPLCGGTGETQGLSERAKRKRRYEKSRANAKRKGKSYTDHDYFVIENLNLSNAEVARKLSRSIKAIENIRYKLRKEKYGRDEKAGYKSDTDIYGS